MEKRVSNGYILKMALVRTAVVCLTLGGALAEAGLAISNWQAFQFDAARNLNPAPYSLPIEGAEEAVSFALGTSETRRQLNERESISPFKRWRAEVRSCKEADRQFWKVTFSSEGIVPTYRCVISFEPSGKAMPQRYPYNFSGYQK